MYLLIDFNFINMLIYSFIYLYKHAYSFLFLNIHNMLFYFILFYFMFDFYIFFIYTYMYVYGHSSNHPTTTITQPPLRSHPSWFLQNQLSYSFPICLDHIIAPYSIVVHANVALPRYCPPRTSQVPVTERTSWNTGNYEHFSSEWKPIMWTYAL